MLGKAPRFVLAVDPEPAGVHVEDPAASGDQFDLLVSMLLEEVRQTGGAGPVVSDLAVGDANLHRESFLAVARGGDRRTKIG